MKKVTKRLKNHFIPNPENDHKPYVLRARTIAFVLMVAMVGEFAFVFGSVYLIPRSKLYGIVEANALVDGTNQNRVSNDLPALQVNPLLQAAAQEKANDMATKGYFAHTSPQGLTPWYWFENVGYSFDYAGENLAVNFSDSKDVTNAWMNSPDHRANILSSDFTQIGIATAQGIYNGKSATYVVEEFGTPAPTAVSVAFVNTASAASVPTTGPIAPVVTTPTKPATKAPITKPVVVATKPTVTTKPAGATIAKQASTSVPVVPTIIAMQNSTGTNSAQTFVAVKGAQAETGAAATSGTVAPAASAIGLTQPQSNWVQKMFSNPKTVANDFYIFLMVLFGFAVITNIFVKIRVQYPKLIFSGLAIIVISGLCIMLNQSIGLLHAAIL